MKLKYILPSLLMLVAGAFTACDDDDDPTLLDEVKVSSSYVALPQAGGTQEIVVNAVDSWVIESVPEWLTVSPLSGEAGETTVRFTAPATVTSYDVTVLLKCQRVTQRINVKQQAAKVETPISPISDVLAGPDATYRVKGVCVTNPDNQYGNWYIDDGTGRLYVYGTNDKKGNKGAYPISGANGWGFTTGDVIVIEGPKTVYNGTVELVDVDVISITKSLIKLEEGESAAFDANGGDFLVRLSYTGGVPSISVAEDGKAWVGISSIEKTDSTTNVVFHVVPNTDEASRTTEISFTSVAGSASSTVTATVSQMGLSGTLTNPFSVADAIAYCQTLSNVSANDFYVKGIISKIEPNGTFGSYGNATFCISDDGVYHGSVSEKNKLVPETSLDFECYRVIWLGNQKWAEGNAQISEGDEVLICGKLMQYNGIAETSSGNAYVYSINGVTTDANGIGSLTAPFNIAGAMSCIDAGFEGNVYVKGIVSMFAKNGEFGAQYGNGTFWISDDGVYNDDLTKDFEAYRALWFGGEKWVDGDYSLAVGNHVILYGQLTKYGSTYETSSGKAYVYSCEEAPAVEK